MIKKLKNLILSGDFISVTLIEGNYERKKIQLTSGERLVFFSDAVVEIDNSENSKTGYKWFEKFSLIPEEQK